ncbi:hypothetical protein PSI17_14460 [Xenorhabdus sp. IM139775]|nr:hypothetical protein [Xenorhabdus sp. IM139775]
MWYICAPLEADIVKFNYDEGFLILSIMANRPVTRTGNLSRRAGVLRLF